MALTARQVRILNDLPKYEPALRKGQLSAADQILLGDLLAKLEMPALASAAASAVTQPAADATYGTEERDLINELRTIVGQLVTLTNEIRTNINAHAA